MPECPPFTFCSLVFCMGLTQFDFLLNNYYSPIHRHDMVCFLQLHLVAANEPYSGNMRGVSGADYTCYREAKAAGMRGTYRAFVTSRVQNLDSLVHHEFDRSIPVVNVKVIILLYFFSSSVGRRNGYEYQSSTLSCPVRPPPLTPHFPYLYWYYTSLSTWFSVFLTVSFLVLTCPSSLLLKR